MRLEIPAEPWLSFLTDLDEAIEDTTELHCIGGFVVVHAYGLARSTADIDVLSVVPPDRGAVIIGLAGKGSTLHLMHRVYLDVVTVATAPEAYQERLRPMFASAWKRLRLFALDPHDLALSKLERNFERDRADVEHLARQGLLSATTLRRRYQDELRPYLLSRHSWHDQTLEMWIESYVSEG